MGRLAPNRLTARKVETLKVGVYGDGGGLWVTVTGKARTWGFRYTSPTTGRRREMGLGPIRDISLASAREAAADARRMLSAGVDPIDARKAAKAARLMEQGISFRTVAEMCIAERRAGWKDARGEEIWRSSLIRHAYPIIGDKRIDAIGTEDVLAVLRPIWATTTETADRVRGRIERILDFASARGWRSAPNAAKWKGHLSSLLAAPGDVTKPEHHAALPYSEIPRTIAALSLAQGVGALAVRFACLTAARSGEVRFAVWGEIDFSHALWLVPAERMKAKKEHRVPLSAAAVAVLRTAQVGATGPDSLIFPGGKQGRPLTDVALSKALHAAAGTRATTVHGLRSSFRTWAAEQTDAPRDVAEAALAHVNADRVEKAYKRTDFFDLRSKLMDHWADFCVTPPPKRG